MSLAERLLVVIPVLNEAAHIEPCVRSLLADPELKEVECLVADGGSTDGTQGIVERLAGEFPGLRLLDNPGRLQAAGVNLGARAGSATRDILIRCDAHADYPERFLLRVAGALEKQEADSLVVPMDAVGTGCFQKANAWVVDTPLGSGGSAHRGGTRSGFVDHGHHAAFRRQRFLELGGYDETFSHNEDAEYDARLARAGGRIYLEADIRLGYYPRETVQGLWRQYFGYGEGRARNIAKNSLQPRLRQMIPVANIILLALSFLFVPFTGAGWIWPVLYAQILLAVSLFMMLTRQSLCGLWSGVALGVMHIAWGAGFLSHHLNSPEKRLAG